MKLCECGCETEVKPDRYGIPGRYAPNHEIADRGARATLVFLDIDVYWRAVERGDPRHATAR